MVDLYAQWYPDDGARQGRDQRCHREPGGLAGYGIGDRWGRKLLDRPGRWHEREKAVATAAAIYG